MVFDLRVFLAAALVASPAAVLALQGELPLDQALIRLLVVMVGATAATMAVRTLWPLLAGPGPETTESTDPAGAAEPGELAGLSPRPE